MFGSEQLLPDDYMLQHSLDLKQSVAYKFLQSVGVGSRIDDTKMTHCVPTGYLRYLCIESKIYNFVLPPIFVM